MLAVIVTVVCRMSKGRSETQSRSRVAMLRACSCVQPGHSDEKLVARTASYKVVAAQIAPKAAGELAQDTVAAVVAVLAVDAGKLVEIEQHESELASETLRPVGLLKEHIQQRLAVEESGEAVVAGVKAGGVDGLGHLRATGLDARGGAQRDSQFELVHRFGEDIVDSGLVRRAFAAWFHGVEGHGLGGFGEHDRPAAPAGGLELKLIQKRHAAQAGQINVENDDGRRFGALERAEQGLAVSDRFDRMSPAAQQRLQSSASYGLGRSHQDIWGFLCACDCVDSGILSGEEGSGHFLLLSARALEP